MIQANLKRNPERGAIVAGVLFLIGIFLILSLLPYFVFGRSVPPNYIGVRQNYFDFMYFLKKGYEPEGLEPGLRWQVPGISTVLLMPRDFQFIDFQGADGDSFFSELDVPTTDGSKVRNEVTVAVRLYDRPEANVSGGKPANTLGNTSGDGSEVPLAEMVKRIHGGPRDLVLKYTATPDTVLRNVARDAENSLKASLSQLSTTEYYNPVLREKAALRSQDSLAERVAPDGVEVFATLIQRYVYAEKTIDDQIFAKNLQDQTERMNGAASKLSAAKANTERERALWDAKIKDLQVEGDSKVKVTESEGSLYKARKSAEGDLLVATARSEVDAARAGVLANSSGADIYLGREIAPLLRTLRGGIVTGIDPFDIEKWVRKLSPASSSSREAR